MSITSDGWNEVERRAVEHETLRHMVKVTVEDRLKGAIIEAMNQIEQGHQDAAWQVLRDALKIRGEL